MASFGWWVALGLANLANAFDPELFVLGGGLVEAGDVLLFDDLFVHQTGSDPSMPNPRYAIESWFFGASGFPADYAPLAA